MSGFAAPNQLQRLARLGRGVIAGFCWSVLFGVGASTAKTVSLSQLLAAEAVLLLLLGLAIVAPYLSLGAGRRGAVIFWGLASVIYAGGDAIGRFSEFSHVGVNDYRLKPVRWQAAPFQGIRFEASGDSNNATVMIDIDGRQVAHIGGLLDHAADVPLSAGTHNVMVRVSGASGPQADVLVKADSFTKVNIPITIIGSRSVGIRTIETEVAVQIHPTMPNKGEWLMAREILVHRSPRPFAFSLLRLLVVSAFFAVALGAASRRQRRTWMNQTK